MIGSLFPYNLDFPPADIFIVKNTGFRLSIQVFLAHVDFLKNLHSAV